MKTVDGNPTHRKLSSTAVSKESKGNETFEYKQKIQNVSDVTQTYT